MSCRSTHEIPVSQTHYTNSLKVRAHIISSLSIFNSNIAMKLGVEFSTLGGVQLLEFWSTSDFWMKDTQNFISIRKSAGMKETTQSHQQRTGQAKCVLKQRNTVGQAGSRAGR